MDNEDTKSREDNNEVDWEKEEYPQVSDNQSNGIDSDISTDYSDWEGPGLTSTVSTPTSSILKLREYPEEGTSLTAQEIVEAKSHYVFPEKSAAVLKASLQKAMLAARRAAIFGFPEPSPYRDEDDPLDDEDDEDYVCDQGSENIGYGELKRIKLNGKRGVKAKRSKRFKGKEKLK